MFMCYNWEFQLTVNFMKEIVRGSVTQYFGEVFVEFNGIRELELRRWCFCLFSSIPALCNRQSWVFLPRTWFVFWVGWRRLLTHLSVHCQEVLASTRFLINFCWVYQKMASKRNYDFYILSNLSSFVLYI